MSMAEPVTTSSAAMGVTAGGITVLGIATGLQPALMLAGAWGGWWAMSYQPPLSLSARLSRIFISAVAAGWLAPGAIAFAHDKAWLPAAIPAENLHFPAALLTGLLAVDVIGRGMLKLARGKARLATRDTEGTP